MSSNHTCRRWLGSRGRRAGRRGWGGGCRYAVRGGAVEVELGDAVGLFVEVELGAVPAGRSWYLAVSGVEVEALEVFVEEVALQAFGGGVVVDDPAADAQWVFGVDGAAVGDLDAVCSGRGRRGSRSGCRSGRGRRRRGRPSVVRTAGRCCWSRARWWCRSWPGWCRWRSGSLEDRVFQWFSEPDSKSSLKYVPTGNPRPVSALVAIASPPATLRASDALRSPVAAGVNVTCTTQLPPAGSVAGQSLASPKSPAFAPVVAICRALPPSVRCSSPSPTARRS